MLHPNKEGINMPHGNDVYLHAIKYMAELPQQLLERNKMSINDVDYLVPHQANIRIINKVAKKLKKGDVIMMSVFGGGYSGGAAILEV